MPFVTALSIASVISSCAFSRIAWSYCRLRGLRHFKVRGKLTLRFIGPFKILEKRVEVAYQLELSQQLFDVHDVFHVSQLKKCLHMPEEQLPMEDFDAKEDLSY
jgi:hypothetical protein